MLKLTVKPGDFIMIGQDVKISFCGGGKATIPIGIDAPKSVPVIRNTARNIKDFENIDFEKKPYIEPAISAEAKAKITAIIAEDRWQNKRKSNG